MNITEIFVRRPVLSSVISLIILVLGLRAAFSMSVRQYPKTEVATVTITTVLYGASPETVAGFITQPLESAIAQAQGIDYLTSSSVSGVSTITVNLRLNYDSTKAVTEINSLVNGVRNQLPSEAQLPQIRVATGETVASMYINFVSDKMPINRVTDYIEREVKPKIQTLPGIQKVEVYGARNFALRAWLDPVRLAGYNLTAADVYAALSTQNYISGLGNAKGQTISIDLSVNTDLTSLEGFRKIVVKQSGTKIVYLEDVANVSLGADNYDITSRFDGMKAVFLGIYAAPDANVLDAMREVRSAFPAIQSQLPPELNGNIVYDATKYINASIDEVVKTLIEALVIVTVVIYLFLGNVRAVVIPTVAMPLSLIGAFFMMFALGYTINLLTLLALVLAIGLVVDDAIIVVENVDRHLKEGLSPFDAAIKGAQELTGPIISMTVVLIAVYIPIGFQQGLTGKLFTEFAFTLAGAVTISGIVALTLSPMMSSRFLTAEEGKFQHKIDTVLNAIRDRYVDVLVGALGRWKVVVVFGFLIMGFIFVLAKMAQKELAPEEDQGFMFSIAFAGPNASSQYMDTISDEVFNAIWNLEERAHTVQFNGVAGANTSFGGLVLKPWDERKRKAKEITPILQNKLNQIAGAKSFISSPPALPGGGGGPPFQMVIKTNEPFENLLEVSQAIEQEGNASGKFFFLQSQLNIDRAQTRVKIDRDKAAVLGLSMRDIGNPLSAMLGGGNVNYFNLQGRAYKVIPQVSQLERLTPEEINDYYIRTSSGKLVPASAVVTLETVAVPETINRFQQQNSAVLQGVPNSFAGVSMGDAINLMSEIAQKHMPTSYSLDFAGQARQTMQESNVFVNTLAFAILIIFLVLAAQFESFRDPIIIMASVPMAIFGAMVFIFWGAATLNIYTEVGLVTLVGLISKHGILIVQFANDEQKRGLSKFEAIVAGARTRLRPILMTTAAMVLGVMPLVFASGAGAVGRFSMGLVIATGIAIGTVFTLFVVPSMYMWLATDHHQEGKTMGMRH